MKRDMRKFYHCGLIAATLLGFDACNFGPPKFDSIAEDYVFTALKFAPSAATGAGYHRHSGVPLDELIEDFSEAGVGRMRDFHTLFREGLSRFSVPEKLTPEDRADYELVQTQISLALLDLNEIKSLEHNPLVYVEMMGNALFSPYVLDYAPAELRFYHIVSRMEKLRGSVAQAKRNLKDSPELWNRLAREANDANIRLIETTLRQACPEKLKQSFEKAAATALPALRDLGTWLNDDLGKRQSDWRLGRELYAKKFRYSLGTDRTPERVLADAEEQLAAIRVQMYQIAAGKKAKLVPSAEEIDTAVKPALDRIASEHATPETLSSTVEADLKEAIEFIRVKVLMPLPDLSNLKVVETPAFMRGSYPVAGFNPAPVMEPKLLAAYWLTPIPPEWPAERVESKLRENNLYASKMITIHEAMPGHYVQFAYASQIPQRGRRLVRSVFGSGTYVEGWAEYVMQMMLEEGFMSHSPNLRLAFLKLKLRATANAILDIRLHTMGMTDEQALELMMRDTFQEREEAEAKLQRAKLSSCQLPTYFVGWRDMLRLRELDRMTKGRGFLLPQFHESVLKAGALPIPILAPLLTGKRLDEAPAISASAPLAAPPTAEEP